MASLQQRIQDLSTRLATEFNAVRSEIPNAHDAVWSYTGTLSVLDGSGRRLYNDSGASRTITSVRAVVGTAPSTQNVIVDVHLDGTTVFTTQGSRPTVVVSNNASTKATPQVTVWPDGSFLTVDVDQADGSDLTVLVSYTQGV